MFIKRTDLALEARELWQESAERTTRLMGVKATKSKLEGYPVTRVDILDHRGEEALEALWQAKCERYYAMEADQLRELEEDGYLKSYGARAPEE